MSSDVDDLENRIIYRLIKVIYFSAHVFLLLIVIYVFYLLWPRYYIADRDKSYITCNDDPTSIVLLSSTNIFINPKNYPLTKENDEDLKFVCARHNSCADLGCIAVSPTYKLNMVYESRWLRFFQSFSTVFFRYILAYAVINIIRETLIYIVYGKKFDWDWIKNLWMIFKKIKLKFSTN